MNQAIWESYCDRLKPAGKLAERSWEAGDPRNNAELYRHLIMDIGLGYALCFGSDPDYPDLMPLLNSLFVLQCNPDDCHFAARIKGDGVYRLSGDRGSVMLLTVNFGEGLMGMSDANGRGTGEYNIGDMVELDGKLDVLISNERPSGHSGDWLYLDPRTDYIMVRQRRYDWGGERDARLSMTRIDQPLPRKRATVEAIDEGIKDSLDFAERLTRRWIGYGEDLKQRLTANSAEFATFAAGVKAQVYWQGIFEIADDEAVILETELPKKVRYWNVQLNDSLAAAIDYHYCQSSLNGAQAVIDSDGKFRAVIALNDPGVANWLDPQQRQLGTFMGRWYEASDHPLPLVKRVKVADLDNHLPRDTHRIMPENRSELIMERVRGGQMRRRW